MRDDDRRLDNCLNCTDCNAACPVIKVLPEFPGPKILGPDMERVRKEGIACDSPWLEYCLGCNRCELTCPNQVNVSELIGRAKLKQHRSGWTGLRDRILSRPDLLGRVCSATAPVANFLIASKPNRWLMSKVLKLETNRPFPKYHATKFAISKNGQSRKIIYLPGCYIRYNDPALNQIAIDLLQRYGSVDIAQTGCCGVPALANGQRSQLMRDLRANVESLGRETQNGAVLVTPCSSCGHMLKAEYPRLIADDPQLASLARSISEHAYDLAEFLLEVSGDKRPELHPVKLRIAYHAPCHLKGQGIGRPWLRILRAIPDVQVEEMAAECCGMAGTFGFKKEKYRISMDIGEELFAAVHAYAPDVGASECGTCRMQIEHGTSIQALHPAEILHRALG